MERRTNGRVELGGRAVAITGGARGIGLATARALTKRGARIALGDLDADLAREAAASLGPSAIGLEVDVTSTDSFRSFLEEAETELGPLHALVNNAGIMWLGSFMDEEESTVERQLAVNLHGVIRGTKLAAPRMIERGGGHIVNLGSAASRMPIPGEATYTAVKHGVLAYSEAADEELRDTGVSVSVIMPGVVATELGSGMDAGRGVHKLGPDEVAEAIVDVLERPRLEVFLPRQIGLFARALIALPPRPRRILTRLAGSDRVARDFDRTARAGYHERALR
jgi:NAD(P)-dependent dehydrogenase (short-subunit alcohol dehydrogenase family)